jgi:LmbE family N-acetylglucosaminyl deacetylase
MKSKTIIDLGRIVGIWAHPDDETWSSGGVMSAAISTGQQAVSVICLTSGGEGETADEEQWPKDSLITIRKNELRTALGILGVDDVTTADFPDGGLANIPDNEVLPIIMEVLLRVQPDTVLTFEPNGITGHLDHKAVSRLSLLAAESYRIKTGKGIQVLGAVENEETYNAIGRAAHDEFNVYFATAQPKIYRRDQVDFCHQLSPALAATKRQALHAHASQTSHFLKTPVGKALLKEACKYECFIRLS